MAKGAWHIFALSILCGPCLAQGSPDSTQAYTLLDSLRQLYPDSIQHQALFQFAEQLYSSHPPAPWQGKLLLSLGKDLKNQQNYPTAAFIFQMALAQYRLLKDSLGIADVLQFLGHTYKDARQADSTFYYYTEAIKYKENLTGGPRLGTAYSSIAIYYLTFSPEETDKSFSYLQKAKAAYQQENSEAGLTYIYFLSGGAYYEQFKQDSLPGLLDSAEDQYRRLLNSENARPPWQESAEYNLGNIYRWQGDTAKALAQYQKIVDRQGDGYEPVPLASAYLRRAEIFLAQNQAYLAEQALRQVIPKTYHNPQLEVEVTGLLQEAYYQQAKYQLAYQVAVRHHLLNDSLNGIAARKNISELEIRFDTERKEQQLVLSEAKRTADARKSRIQMLILLGILLISVLTAALFYYRQRAAKALAIKNTRLHEQEVKQLMQAQELKTIQGELAGQEAERERIARDLHDRINGTLMAAKLHLENETGDRESARNLVTRATEEVREVSHDLMSGVLKTFGLQAALENLATDISQAQATQVQIAWLVGKLNLPAHYAQHLYRIAQEVVTNALKHARAREIIIQMGWMEEHSLQLLIEDDGRGFDPTALSSGIGLQNLKARVEEMKGTIHLESSPGLGTTVEVSIPYNQPTKS
ncbi:MAG TPA: hypothetical protein DCE41_31670 [Cytophagales bacterium]|nr:hypothetical protein [Cytophagales bacterium]HAA23206.1 hypothetical protein [Cytophagales bacterium]HAP64817.1 hypothetical protein [Cytophagales bacterium]